MKSLLIAAALAAALGFGQSRPPAKSAPAKSAPVKDKGPLVKLTVEGLNHYTTAQVLEAAGLKLGQIAGAPEFNAACDRLAETGVFENIGYNFTPAPDGKGFEASFQALEVEPAYPPRFEDLGLPDADIENMLRAKDPLFLPSRLPASQMAMDRYTKWIQEYLVSQGKQEKIGGRVAMLDEDRFAIVFRPARSLMAVAHVAFEGNTVLPERALQDAVQGAAVGAMYTEQGFRQILNASLLPVYEARGRVRVTFPKIRTEPDKDVQGLDVFVTVDEGQSYTLGKITITGPSPIKPDELLKTGDFKSGDVANQDRVNQGTEKVTKAIRHAGYLDVKVTAERQIDDQKKIIDVVLQVDAGSPYTMGKLNIVGLDLEGEAEINRMFTMKPGKPFNPDYPDFFLSKVNEEGLFDNLGKTKAEFKVNSQDHTADVTLTFSGQGPDAKPGRRKREGY